MDPVSLGALIGGGANLVSSAANAFSSSNMNKKNREWNEKMYATQKADNVEFWNMNNAYNSPEQQMLRLSGAGLNPALVYGNGAVANTAGAPDAPHAQPYKAEAPQFNLPNIVDTYFNLQTQQQRLSNDKQLGNNLALDAVIKTEDARAKAMLNDYMSDRGYVLRGEREFFDKELLSRKNTSEGQLIKHNDTAYSLQQMGMKIMNDLRATAVQGNKINNSINQTRSKYQERLMSGKFSDLGARDIMQIVMQGLGMFNSK